MARVERTSQAELDLTDIFLYIARDNIVMAKRVLRDIGRKCSLVASHPSMGRDRSEIFENVRSFPVGNYVVFYRVISEGILLLRILHGARDINGIFD
jgi:toxin ParE1/3/4